jgi:hypothetical protein
LRGFDATYIQNPELTIKPSDIFLIKQNLASEISVGGGK